MKPEDKIKKNNPFRVPEEYFNTLTERTMNAIRVAEVRDSSVETEVDGSDTDMIAGDLTGISRSAGGVDLSNTGKKRIVSFRPFLALAAAIIGVAILAAAMVKLIGSDVKAYGYEPGTSLYADLAFEELDSYMLEAELSETVPEAGEMTEEDISSETIIEYLMTEDIDLNDIYELL